MCKLHHIEPIKRGRRGLNLVALLALVVGFECAGALDLEQAQQLLSKADSLRTADPAEFEAMLDRIDDHAETLPQLASQHLRYLQGWRSAYRGDYTSALATLTPLADAVDGDLTLRFRAGATEANVFVLSSRYEEAFARLSRLLTMLPEISDREAREQGLAVAAYLYNQVGEYELAVSYTDQILTANGSNRAGCNGRQLRIEALYKAGKLKSRAAETMNAIDACLAIGEATYANMIRTYDAKLLMAEKRFEDAIQLLTRHYDEAVRSRYPRLLSEYDALLASAYRELGDTQRVRDYALRAIENGVKEHHTEPIVIAYRLLYVLAKEQGAARDALTYLEKYVAADKGYIDDVTARQLAYQRVSHAAVADKLRIDTLNKENEVLQLQRALDKKRVETSSLYIALLMLVLVTIAFWAYRTKRSQLHFMRLSQVDGLTGIANRPRFIELAESALENGRKGEKEVCVVLCDLDHFKSINDKHGHAAGDFVLKQTVAACQMHLRTSDIFGRFGGEEFGIVLPGCSLEDARQRAEQLRLAIAAISGNYEGVEINVSGSFGVASSATTGFELRQLLAHADAALYRAKNEGRNCVIVADGRSTEPLAAPGARYGFSEGAADAMARVVSGRDY